jgi:hypothetical protein
VGVLAELLGEPLGKCLSNTCVVRPVVDRAA